MHPNPNIPLPIEFWCAATRSNRINDFGGERLSMVFGCLKTMLRGTRLTKLIAAEGQEGQRGTARLLRVVIKEHAIYV